MTRPFRDDRKYASLSMLHLSFSNQYPISVVTLSKIATSFPWLGYWLLNDIESEAYFLVTTSEKSSLVPKGTIRHNP